MRVPWLLGVFVAVLMCGNEAVCVIGCASERVVLIPLRVFGRHQTDKQCG